jgi:hypothetical protein
MDPDPQPTHSSPKQSFAEQATTSHSAIRRGTQRYEHRQDQHRNEGTYQRHAGSSAIDVQHRERHRIILMLGTNRNTPNTALHLTPGISTRRLVYAHSGRRFSEFVQQVAAKVT